MFRRLMKRLTLTIALILTCLMSYSQTKDSNGHVLVSLWKTYYKALDADRPQDQLKALQAIKTEASAKHLAWDFYDACDTYASVRTNINWKDRSAARTDFGNEIQKMGEPVAVYYFNNCYHQWDTDAAVKYVAENKDKLLKSNNPEFYRNDSAVSAGAIYSPVLLKRIANDYEYTLWSLFLGKRAGNIDAWYGDRYPFDAFIEYTRATRFNDKSGYEKAGEFAVRYKDKAVSLLALQYRLSHDFSQMRRDTKTTSDQYKALRKRCDEFEAARASYTGEEKQIADCCTGVESLIETLDAKEIDGTVKDNELSLRVRNVPSVRVKVMKDDKVIYETTVHNDKRSYYVYDNLAATLPDLNDDDYELKCSNGDCEDVKTYNKHTLSIAVRPDAECYGVFVADYITGKPVDQCDLYLLDADRNTLAKAAGVKFDGFTRLPGALRTHFTDKYKDFYLRAAYDDGGRKRLSRPIRVTSPNPGRVTEIGNSPVKHALLITDRGAYNPGETLHFKAVLYTGTYEYTLADAGSEVTADLYSPKDEKLGSMTLRTNEFGSVEGSFPLTGSDRGGMYTVHIRAGGSILESRAVRVDEFVLPTFDVTWDADNKLYLPGDVIKVSGKVSAYSGHSLGSAKVRYNIGREVKLMGDKELELSPDGGFEFEFGVPLESWSRAYPVELTVTDATGETLTFSTVKRVYSEPRMSLSLLNKVPGRYTEITSYSGGNDWIVRDSHADIRFDLGGLQREGLEISYILSYGNEEIRRGSAAPGETVSLDLQGLKSGLYRIEAVAQATRTDGKVVKTSCRPAFVKAADSDTALDMDVACFFKELGDKDIALQIGSTDGPVWAVVELFGSGNVLLEHQIITLTGERGKAGSLKTVSYERRAGWPETLTLTALFFHKGECYRYTRKIELPVDEIPLPLAFTRFYDSTRPGQEYSLLIKTEPGVECAATMYDKATETIMNNEWYTVRPFRRPEPGIYYTTVCGQNQALWSLYSYGLDDALPMAKGARMASVNSAANVAMVEEEAAPFLRVEDSMEAAADKDSGEEMRIRESFGATMAWEPMLRSDSDGNIEFRFTGSDRLSTYYVQLFAHGEGMKNAVLRREMQVTIPVKVAIVEPQFLYAGDVYKARVTVSSNQQDPVTGRVAIRFYDGGDYKTAKVIGTRSAQMSLPCGGSLPFDAEFPVPEGISELGIMVNFVADDPSCGTDAVFVKVPVMRPLQTLTEAHSALLRSGADREALIAELRSLFVNLDPAAIKPVERSIIDMIREAIPDKIEPESDNVMALTEAYYSNVLARRLGAPGLDDARMAEIMEKIAACQNQGGGITWFEGMEASPVITAAVLQRIASMPGEDTGSIDIEKAVKYLDDSYFGQSDRPWWCGGISMELYLHTRAMYPSVPFEIQNSKEFRAFKKEAKAYLVPSGKRGLNGMILAKARRLRTLQLLAQSQDGAKLAKAWGINMKKRILRSLDADVESLLQYAVDHVSGGCYYPNAVMPWRGLLESELYAHSLLCDLFTSVSANKAGGAGGNAPRPLGVQGDNSLSASADRSTAVAEGIRLWLMVQKETQQWEKDAAYIEAIASVLRGTPETLATKVIALSGTFTKPFEEVLKTGNGFTVARSFSVDGRELAEGDTVRVGDRVVARYRIWSEENRSFVRLTAPRPASFRPVNQLSGHYGWWLRPMVHGSWSFSPQGYCNVLSDKTEYWFDSYPEENTTVTEEFFVTQEGRFQMPAVEIESLYAPHYRANDAGRGALESR